MPAKCRDSSETGQLERFLDSPEKISFVIAFLQPYRHVDYVQFENPFLMERFLNYWRHTGCQRMGYMFGRYEHHKDVPLGIKAVVSAIYEPPQV